MFAIYFYMRENDLRLKSGFFKGFTHSQPGTVPDIFPGAKFYTNQKRAQNAAKLMMANHFSISGYQIHEINSKNLCPFFECTSFETVSCPNNEGCMDCNVYGNCNFCDSTICSKDSAYYKYFSKLKLQHAYLPNRFIFH